MKNTVCGKRKDIGHEREEINGSFEKEIPWISSEEDTGDVGNIEMLHPKWQYQKEYGLTILARPTAPWKLIIVTTGNLYHRPLV